MVLSDEGAQVLIAPRSRAFMKPFLGREASAAQASQELGVSLQAMHYQILKLLRLGLITLSRTEKRRGRAVKYYRSTHEVYFIPFEQTRYVDSEEALSTQVTRHVQALVTSVARVMDERRRVGQYLYRGQDGEVWLTGSAPGEEGGHLPDHHIVIDGWGTVRLTRAQAQRYQATIRELLQSFETSGHEEEAEEYLYTLMLAPLQMALHSPG